MTDLPSYDLELRAAEERRQLHTSVEELRSRLRENFDFKKNAHDHLLGACSLAAVIGLAAGYGLTGIFVHK